MGDRPSPTSLRKGAIVGGRSRLHVAAPRLRTGRFDDLGLGSYSKLVEKFERRMKPKIKGRIHVDDVVLKVGKKDCYAIQAVDSRTKYNLECMFVGSRSLRNFKEFLEQSLNTRWMFAPVGFPDSAFFADFRQLPKRDGQSKATSPRDTCIFRGGMSIGRC